MQQLSARSFAKNRWLRRTARYGLAALLVAVSPLNIAFGDQPLAVCAVPSVSASGTTLLLDPENQSAVAVLSDPAQRLPTGQRKLIFQTMWTKETSAGLPRLVLTDAAPEFWAQPASWLPFVRGAANYSGFGTELRARDWAGLPASDQRASRLDSGLRPLPTTGGPTPPGPGAIQVRTAGGALVLVWNGLGGRVYGLHHTADLRRPFELTQTIIADQNGEMQVSLPMTGAQGFYRLTEIFP